MEQFFRLQEGEKILYDIKPLPGLRWFIFFKFNMLRIVLPSVLIFFYILTFGLGEIFQITFFQASDDISNLFLSTGAGAVIGLGINFIFSSLEFNKQQYWITDKRIVYKRGIIGYRVTSIPYERISDVIISRTFIERIFRFGSLHIQSLAGQAVSSQSSLGSEGVLLAVDQPEKLQEIIFKLVKVKRKAEGITF